MSKILIFGGHGLLGTELRKLNHHVYAPTHKECNISEFDDVKVHLSTAQPDVVINCAAVMDNRSIEQNPFEAIQTNIIGAANIAHICAYNNIRLVYISTDYCYPGDQGNYKEGDPVLPFNAYAWSKLGGECSSRLVKNHLIIRTSFGSDKFAYTEAFTDKWASKGYVDEIAPLILEAALSPLTGVLNLGLERRTLYAHASERNAVKPVRLADTNFFTPYDTSLNLQKWMDYKSLRPAAKPHTKCRACDSERLTKYVDLGLMPLANGLEITSLRAKAVERYPLQVMFCEDCGLHQLSVVIDPEIMYSNYAYRSGISQGYINHCRQMAKDLHTKFFTDIEPKDEFFHIDIAGNDGTLLSEFHDQYQYIDHKPLNVDPAANLAAIAEVNGIPTFIGLWGDCDMYQHPAFQDGGANLITATNVFAHVDSIRQFLKTAKRVLKPDGILVIEVPYLLDFLENMEYATTYFEHLSTMSIGPVHKLCQNMGLFIVSVEHFDIHCGSVRITIAKEGSKYSPDGSHHLFMKREELEKKDLQRWAADVRKISDNLGKQLLALRKEGKRIACIGASAKLNTLLNYANVNTDLIDFICDDTSEKIGKYSPGTGIPIVSMHELARKQPDYLLIGAWNFETALMKRAKESGYKNKFIVPIPEFKVI